MTQKASSTEERRLRTNDMFARGGKGTLVLVAEPVPGTRAIEGVLAVHPQRSGSWARFRLERLLQLTTARAVYRRAMGLQLKGSCSSTVHDCLLGASGRAQHAASAGEVRNSGFRQQGGLIG